MFKLTKQQKQKLSDWMEKNTPDKYCGAIGGRWTYSFTPTTLGIAVSVRDNLTKLEIDLTEYEDW